MWLLSRGQNPSLPLAVGFTLILKSGGPETTPVCFPDGGQLAGVLARAGKCVLPASGSEINGIECVCVNDMPSLNGCSINPSSLLFGFP